MAKILTSQRIGLWDAEDKVVPKSWLRGDSKKQNELYASIVLVARLQRTSVRVSSRLEILKSDCLVLAQQKKVEDRIDFPQENWIEQVNRCLYIIHQHVQFIKINTYI